MNLLTALLLAALTLAGIGLFVRAWTRGMAFGDRLEARQRAARADDEVDEDRPADP